ncbi:MAG: tripartite tricarboxylate transporter substrate binding protein [Burkholderiaceae bacterium]|jgi:tripartite-type tricarboxylate transporter receptor subunit TctC|nr:tripartite tricarboxylate transporter substrate binding protein [Burkholderiales bacterium]MCZ8337787.1 tripartite tricarboxylate transporter substrate binding protein [Burkholderiaceae bacterium]
MTTPRRTLLAAALAAAGLALPAAVSAQAWPNKPIRLLVGFAPGGGTDIVARALAPKISDILGQQVVVENRAGAAGTIAADAVAKAAPDGYTLLAGHANSNAIAPHVLAKAPFDPIADFTPVTYIGYVPNILVVHPSVPAKSVEELIALAKARPGTMTYASSGVGSTQHLAGALFNQLSGTQMNHVPYKGSGAAIVDLLAGQVNANFDTMPPVLPHIREGKLRALAISTPKRLPQLADLPTFEEKGIRGFDVTNWYSVMGPKGLPADIVAKLDDAVRRAMADPEVRSKLDPQGVQFGGPQTPAAFAEFIRAENAKYARMVKELNVRAD